MALCEAGPACLVLSADAGLARAVAEGLRSRLPGTPVLVPPLSAAELAAADADTRVRTWWDRLGTGVDISRTTLLIVGAENLAGLGRAAYVAVPPGRIGARTYVRGGAVIEVAATTVGDLVNAVVRGGTVERTIRPRRPDPEGSRTTREVMTRARLGTQQRAGLQRDRGTRRAAAAPGGERRTRRTGLDGQAPVVRAGRPAVAARGLSDRVRRAAGDGMAADGLAVRDAPDPAGRPRAAAP